MLKQTIKVGNSAGVLLPKKYLGSLVEIRIKTLTKEEIKKQIITAAYPYLKYITGIYLTGSYARNEEGIDSDVDIVIISNKKLNLDLKNYHLIYMNPDTLSKNMEENLIGYYPMLSEAETIINEVQLKKLLKKPLTKKSLKWHLEGTKSALAVIKKALETEDKELIVNDAIIYSLMLRLRQIYLCECMLNKQKGTTKGLMKYAREIGSIGSLYETYRKLRDNEKVKIEVNIDKIKRVYKLATKKLEEQEKEINGLKKEKKAT